jgi:hypothetical protein
LHVLFQLKQATSFSAPSGARQRDNGKNSGTACAAPRHRAVASALKFKGNQIIFYGGIAAILPVVPAVITGGRG